MKELLEGFSKGELIDFITKHASNNNDFANAVDVRFREPKFAAELNKIGGKVYHALEGASDYRRHDNWGYIDFSVEDIVTEINQRAEQGHIKLAFAELALLYRKLLENFEYQSECEISDVVEDCLKMMAQISDKAVLPEDRDYIFNQCVVLSMLEDGKDYGADYEDRLLAVAVKFVTTDNRAAMEEAVASFGWREWRKEDFLLIQLEIIRKLDGEHDAELLVAENLHFPKIREIAFTTAMSRKDYPECERLCKDAMSSGECSYGVSPWLYKLYDVYEAMANTVEMVGAARSILLCGDLEYYNKLKSLLQTQGSWDKSYNGLLQECEQKLSASQYMDILTREEEYASLLEQVKQHAEHIYRYGKALAKKYPVDVCAIFTAQISKEAGAAYGREHYREVCSRIRCFAQAGYRAEAMEMLLDFQLRYKRKPAFADELRKTWI